MINYVLVEYKDGDRKLVERQFKDGREVSVFLLGRQFLQYQIYKCVGSELVQYNYQLPEDQNAYRLEQHLEEFGT